MLFGQERKLFGLRSCPLFTLAECSVSKLIVNNLPVPLTPLKADEKQEIRNSTHWRGVLAR